MLAPPDAVLTISFKALQRARTTIEDFVQSYFPYLGLDIPTALFRHLDVLVFVEATIYQLDEDNEALSAKGEVLPGHKLVGDASSPLLGVLSQRGLLDERIEAELRQGDEYWELERRLCAQMLQAGDAQCSDAGLLAADVMRCHEAKSFDYRVLNLLLHRLEHRPYDEQLLRFLRVDEMLVDIGDDLFDYEDDVAANSFNIFRAYVFLHCGDAELKLVERIGALEKEHGELLAQLPEPLQQHYWRRHKEAAREGEGASRWVFPPPIMDEQAFRRSL